MNVIIANKQQSQLSNLDIDIIKNISGEYEVMEIVEMFKNFFYSKMILDVTAIKNYSDLSIYQELIHGLDAEKIIFLLPEGSNLCTANYLSKLIKMGIYNFTTNLDGVVYLLKKPNTLKDVEHILKMAGETDSPEKNNSNNGMVTTTNVVRAGTTIIGFRDVTVSAGATSLIYMILRELSAVYGKSSVMAAEIDKNDFALFNDKRMVSVKKDKINVFIKENTNLSFILVDLNNCEDDSFCGEVINLIEPSTIKLNRLVRSNKMIFSKLANKKVVLNKSLLLNNDVYDFESEAGIKVFYNLPPLDERKRNAIINDFLTKLGIISPTQAGNNSGKIFGLFRR